MDLPSPGNLRLTANRILTCFIVTHASILTCCRSTARYRTASAQAATLSYHFSSTNLGMSDSRCPPKAGNPRINPGAKNKKRHPKVGAGKIRGFGIQLIPDHYRRRTARPVSYYALFKWWLLLSQHPGCHSNPTSLVT